MDDAEITRMAHKCECALRYKFLGAHYPIDLEQCVWTAMFHLLQKPDWEQTQSMLQTIAYRIVLKELDKVRNTFVTDKLDEQLSEDDELSFDKLTFDTLDEREKTYIRWYIEDGLSKTDIAELDGCTIQTVLRHWRIMVRKLKKENGYEKKE